MKLYFSLPRPLNRLLGSHTRCSLIAAALAVSCYWNSLGCLVHDDIFAIRDNADVRPETPLTSVFSNDFWGRPMSSNTSHKSYRPLTILSFRANYALHGLEPWGYHGVNVGLHAAVTVMVGWLCRRLAFPEPDLTFLVMCLFASHPVHTEAVTGVVGRAELLSSLCFLLSLISYTSSLTRHTSTAQQSLTVVVSVLLGGMAMLFKETGATVLCVCLAYDLLVHSQKHLQRCLINRTSPLLPTLSPLLLRTLTLLLTSTLLLIARVLLLHGSLPQFSNHDNPASFSPLLTTRALTYSYLFFFNSRLLVFPLTLCYDWQMGSIPLVERLGDTRNCGTLLFIFFLFSLSALSLLKLSSQRTSSRVVLLSLLLVVVPFLPASNLLFRVGFVVAERVLYIPSIGYCILLVQGVKTLSLRLHPLSHPPTPSSSLPRSPTPPLSHPHTPSSSLPPSPTAPRSHFSLFLLVLLLVGLFSVRTILRNPVWTSRESLFRSGLATVPHNAKIHYNYANYLRDTGRGDEAAHHYSLAIRLAPDHVSSHNNLGSLPGLSLQVAEFHFREAVRYSPTHYRALYNLGNNLLNQGRLEEAEQALRDSLKVNGEYSGSLMTLATILTDTGRGQEGLRLMEKAVGVAPSDTLVRNNMAALSLRLGRQNEAIKEYQYSLSLDPSQTAAMNNLARAYRSRGDNREAEHWFLQSLELREDVDTLSSLGALYFNTGRFSDAAHVFSRALALQPSHLTSQCSFVQSLIQLGEEEEAEAEAMAALEQRSRAPCLHLALASICAKNTSRLQEAIHHSTLALEAGDDRTRAESSLILASALRDLGQLDEAEDSYRQAIALSPTMLNAHMNLGALLHIRKKYAEARLHYEKALSLDPGNKLVTENLAKLNRAHKQQQTAL